MMGGAVGGSLQVTYYIGTMAQRVSDDWNEDDDFDELVTDEIDFFCCRGLGARYVYLSVFEEMM